MPAKRPNSRRNLDVALERLVGKPNLIAKRAIMANTIVAQMLPDDSVKGGSAIKMRLGDGATRFDRPRHRANLGHRRLFLSSIRRLWQPDGRPSRARWSRRGKRIPKAFPRNM